MSSFKNLTCISLENAFCATYRTYAFLQYAIFEHFVLEIVIFGFVAAAFSVFVFITHRYGE